MGDSRKTSNSSGLAKTEAVDEIKPLPRINPPLTGAVQGESAPPSPDSNVSNVLRVEDHLEKTAYAWSSKKKWILLTVVALCQTSMNFNAAIYSNAVGPINEHFGVKNARMGMVAFLVTYAFGCELWAPWSEELGRWIVMQSSLGCVNVSIILCALAPNFPTVLAGRAIGGLSSAGGSVTLGMVADMFHAEEQQYAVLWASLWSCLGSVVGGVCGGPIEQFLSWRWNFWVQLIFGVTTQVVHYLVAQESRATCMLDKEAKKLRKKGKDVFGPNEALSFKERFNTKKILTTMWRPYHMLLTEPIILFLSLLSGFADALIFSFFESYGYVFALWNFNATQRSLALLPLGFAYCLAYFTFFPVVRRHNKQRRDGKILKPEARLEMLLFQVVLLPIGLLGSAFVAKQSVHWSATLIFAVLIGMANYSIYYATIDYMVASYGVYSASATGGNGFCRDFLAGVCALYTGPMYHNLGIQNSTLLLFGIAAVFCIPVFIFYWKGPQIRKRSKFAEQLARENDVQGHGQATLVTRDV
ncbi:multidrug transporter [Dendryphion nanum]|uniref:Multidrug transporter n=1 Tax=Dendryphion nanum TaxID=256645 RepID=A0A9P9EJU5_9PLEO|nr:multidrug transporter [Dendryphion nanum]